MLKFLSAGESHGPQLTVIIDGFPAGFQVNLENINAQLSRRQKGFGRGARMKIESDRVEVVSGLRNGYTLGSPITFVIQNRDWDNWKDKMSPLGSTDSGESITQPRPGHADLPGAIKYNHRDIRNVLERASARETAARVAVGSLTRQFLEKFDIRFASHVIQIGKVKLSGRQKIADLGEFARKVEKSPVRCADDTSGKKMVVAIRQAQKSRDSLGGVVELIVRGVPVGLGGFSQAGNRLDGQLAAALMSIPSVKGVEVGLGFGAASKPGSKTHDEIFYMTAGQAAKKGFYRKTNNAGGIEGGISNGEDIVMRFAAKPIATLSKPLMTVDIETKKKVRAAIERADICVVPVLGVVGEAVAAQVLATAFLDKFGSDNMAEIERNYEAFLKNTF